MVCCYVTHCLFMQFFLLFVAFTYWTLMITTAWVYTSYIAAQDDVLFAPLSTIKNKDQQLKSFKAQANHHLMYTLSVLFNLVTVVVYWSFLHEMIIEKFTSSPNISAKNKRGIIFHMYIVHSLPALACLINALATNVIMKRGLWKIVLYASLI